MFRLEMLPAANGDCLWIEYGSAGAVHRILIDAGLASTYENLRGRILALPKHERIFELLIVTHVDNDHIEGVIPLLQDSDLGCVFKDVWYNGWKHLEDLPDVPGPEDVLGPREGEFLGVLLEDQGLPWNEAFSGGRIMVPNDGDLPTFEIAGLKLTLLSPTQLRLIKMRDEWRRAAMDANFTPGDHDAIRAQLRQRKYVRTPAGVLGVEEGPAGRDNSEANGSSIAVLAEHDGVKALLTGDAFAAVLQQSLTRLGATKKRPIAVDLWKLAHHGSWQNFTPELLEFIRTRRYLVSTNGRTFHHPHAKTINCIIEQHGGRRRPELVFNYRSETTEPWANRSHPRASDFVASYPSGAVLLL